MRSIFVVFALAALALPFALKGELWSEGRKDMQNKSNAAKSNVCDSQLEANLSPLQRYVTRQNGTEPAFLNSYWNNKRPGIYVDVISGEPLFSSTDKFDSGTGWPSFTKPIDQGSVVSKEDMSHGMVRTEVRSNKSDAHLGHIFDDGPGPGGLRYCINSASLRFIPLEDLEKEGYGRYLDLFKAEEAKKPGTP